jgi:beta-N-acetylhexosaminidase
VQKKSLKNLQQSLGQCFWIGINGATADDSATREIFSAFRPGGVILFQRNVETIRQVKTLIHDLQRLAGRSLYIAVDQEGGTVERLHALIGTVPPAMAFAAAGSRNLIRKTHRAHARLLRALGFNVNFTPVLDLARTDRDNAIGTRCYSNDPDQVSSFASDVISAHLAENVLICGKHFPGLGDAAADSHLELPIVKTPWRRILQRDLLPYQALLSRLPFIMVNHALYPQQNSVMPASLAPEIVHDLLLKDWNYGGLAISDDLHMGAVSSLFGLPQAFEKALLAGNHMALICKPEGVIDAFEHVMTRASAMPDLAAIIQQNCGAILRHKKRYQKANKHSISIKEEIAALRMSGDLVAAKAVTVIRGRALNRHSDSCSVFLPHHRRLVSEPSALSQTLIQNGVRVNETRFAADDKAEHLSALGADSRDHWNIVVLANPLKFPAQMALIDQLLNQKKQVAVIAADFPALRLPAKIKTVLCSYWASPMALQAAAEVLLGKRKAAGTLPLHL